MKIIVLTTKQDSEEWSLLDLKTNKIEARESFFYQRKHGKIDQKTTEIFLAKIKFKQIHKQIDNIVLVSLGNIAIDENSLLWLKKFTNIKIVSLKTRYQNKNKKINTELFFIEKALKTKYTNVIVVNLDKLTTFLVIQKKQIVGRIFAPGLATTKQILIKHADLIDDFKGYDFDDVLTIGTEKAVSAGVIFNQIGMIKYLIKKLNNELRQKTPVVLTGKNLVHLKPFFNMSYQYEHNWDLIISGIGEVYQQQLM